MVKQQNSLNPCINESSFDCAAKDAEEKNSKSHNDLPICHDKDYGQTIQESLKKFYSSISGDQIGTTNTFVSSETIIGEKSGTKLRVFDHELSINIRNASGIEQAKYFESICTEHFKGMKNQGQSGALFFISGDDSYLIKTISRSESKFLKKYQQHYYEKVVEKKNHSLLTKFFEHFKISISHSKHSRKKHTFYMVIMNNLFAKIKCNRIYDLKGSSYKRLTSQTKSDGSFLVLKDLNFIKEYENGILLEEGTCNHILSILENDSMILRDLNVVDYSLLLGIKFLDRNSSSSGDESGFKIVLTDKEIFLADKCEKSESGTSNSTYLPPGAIFGKANDKSGMRVILFLQIIDILIEFNLVKRGEYAFKSTHQKNFSVIPAPKYQARFIEFMKTIFKSYTHKDPNNEDFCKLSKNTMKYIGEMSTNSQGFITFMSNFESSEKKKA